MNRIFTITPGRSGIHYLSAIFRFCTSLPETGYKEYFTLPELNLRQRELFVAKIWKELPENYVSTTLHPKNGYLKILHKYGARFIHLKRDIKDNAQSWLNMEGIPGRTVRGQLYHPKPIRRNNCIYLNSINKVSDLSLCIWLNLEIRARAEYMKSQGADVYEVDLYDLNEKENIIKLLEWTGYEYSMLSVDKALDNFNLRNSLTNIPDQYKSSKKFKVTNEEFELAKNNLTAYLVHNNIENIDI